jgi:hypothetical protein
MKKICARLNVGLIILVKVLLDEEEDIAIVLVD